MFVNIKPTFKTTIIIDLSPLKFNEMVQEMMVPFE